jgi:hypothetical protein
VICNGRCDEWDSDLWDKYFKQEPRNATEKQMIRSFLWVGQIWETSGQIVIHVAKSTL